MYSNEIVCNTLDYINKNIMTKIKIKDLSDYLNYDRYYIMKLFKKELNISIIDYINIIKIKNSLQSIRENNNLLNISLNNGYYSLEYFSEMFKKILGINPSTYKKIINKNINIKEKELKIFEKNYSKIAEKIEYINKYKNNRKPTTYQVKKLSIFK